MPDKTFEEFIAEYPAPRDIDDLRTSIQKATARTLAAFLWASFKSSYVHQDHLERQIREAINAGLAIDA